MAGGAKDRDGRKSYLEAASPRFRSVFKDVATVVKTEFPLAMPVFEWRMPGWRVKLPKGKIPQEWKGTCPRDCIVILLVERKSGITLHYWNPLDFFGVFGKFYVGLNVDINRCDRNIHRHFGCWHGDVDLRWWDIHHYVGLPGRFDMDIGGLHMNIYLWINVHDRCGLFWDVDVRAFDRHLWRGLFGYVDDVLHHGWLL